jgi:uncharacterized membrane protein YhaH (DUF805 family)
MFNLQKRINRRTYWAGSAIYFVAIIMLGILISVLPASDWDTDKFVPATDIPGAVIGIALLWYEICLTRQRANDISGRHSLAWLFLSVALIGPIIGFIPGEKKTNRFGAPSAGVNLLKK